MRDFVDLKTNTAKCRHCPFRHPLVYLNMTIGKAMYYICPVKGFKVFVQRVDGLNIPEHDSKKLVRRETDKKQLNFL